MNAPSAGNERPWHFIVVKDKKTLNRMADVHPYAQMLREAHLAIITCYDIKLVTHEGYADQDCALASLNMMLCAHALGLGSVYVGVHPRKEREDELRDVLGIPKEIIPFNIIPIGYPAESKGKEDKSIPSRVHKEKW
jgi:nitroreductase